MITRFNGRCAICKRPTKAGVDFYDIERKESYHAQCKQNVDTMDESTGHEDAESLADRLGYRKED